MVRKKLFKKIRKLLENIFLMLSKRSNFLLILLFVSFFSLFQVCVSISASQLNDTVIQTFSQEMTSYVGYDVNSGYVVYDDKTNDIFNYPSNYWYSWRSYFSIHQDGLEYLPTMNAAKKSKIHIISDKYKSNNLTFLYSENYYSTEMGKYHRDGVFGFTLASYGTRYANSNFSFIYISESHAKSILNNEDPSLEDYENLIGETIQIEINNAVNLWTIGNVIIEDNKYMNFFNVVGDFALTSNIDIPDIQKEATFTFSNKKFVNEYKINYIRKNFKELNNMDLLPNFVGDHDHFFDVMDRCISLKSNTNVFPIIGIIFSSCILFIPGAIIYIYLIFSKKKKMCLLCTLFMFVPYTVFSILKTHFGLFALFSTTSNTVIAVAISLLLFVFSLSFLKKGNETNE